MKWIWTIFVLILGDFLPRRTDSSHVNKPSWGESFMSAMFGQESCNSEYITPNFTKLENDFKNRLYGQHYVETVFLPLLKAHYLGEPVKPLVVSMHGWSGCGKNYVSNMVIEALYKKGLNSKFVHMINGLLDFPHARSQIDLHKYNLQERIKKAVIACPLSIFVFDEVDHVPPEIVNGIKPFLDYHPHIAGVDYRKAVFLFLTNLGGDAIFANYQTQWRNGHSRLSMSYTSFEHLLKNFLYGTKGVFEKSAVISGHLISMYLPFLPLERKHVRLCIQDEFRRQGKLSSPENVDKIINELEYTDDIYSVSGCKGISDLVSIMRGEPLRTRDDSEL